MFKFFSLRLFFAYAFILSACLSCFQNPPPSSAEELSSTIGSEMVVYMTLCNKICAAAIRPKLTIKSIDDVEIVGVIKEFDEKELRIFKKNLINDDHYHFSLMQKNLFVPDVVVKFPSKDFFILVARSTQQLKFFFPGGKKILDIDPSATAMIEFFNTIESL